MSKIKKPLTNKKGEVKSLTKKDMKSMRQFKDLKFEISFVGEWEPISKLLEVMHGGIIEIIDKKTKRAMKTTDNRKKHKVNSR